MDNKTFLNSHPFSQHFFRIAYNTILKTKIMKSKSIRILKVNQSFTLHLNEITQLLIYICPISGLLESCISIIPWSHLSVFGAILHNLKRVLELGQVCFQCLKNLPLKNLHFKMDYSPTSDPKSGRHFKMDYSPTSDSNSASLSSDRLEHINPTYDNKILESFVCLI